MKKDFSKAWKASTQPRKQRKYAANAPSHIRQRFLGATISKELRKKHNRRSVSVRKGDKVKILRGQFKGKIGKIERVNLNKIKVYITGIEVLKRDGSKTLYPIHPSNLVVQELEMGDKRRMKQRKKEAAKKQ